jgi:hypothetical protein
MQGVMVAVLLFLAFLPSYIIGDVAVGYSLDRKISVEAPVLYNSQDNPIEVLEINQRGTIRVLLYNNIEHEQPFVLLVEIREGDGRSIHFSFVEGALEVKGNYTSETFWTAPKFCGENDIVCDSLHEIRTFAISGWENPELLSNVNSFQGFAVVDSTEQNDTIYRLSLGGNTYAIEYILPRGDIGAIHADRQLQTITVSFQHVPAETSLSITFPKSLLDEIFPPSNPVPGGNQPYMSDIFVDGNPVQPRGFLESNESFTWVILIPQDSEDLEFTRSLLP